MLRRDPRVDAYIAAAPAYAKPIMKRLRALVHRADKTLTEDIKWGSPTFMKDGMVCSFHAFKHHVGFWFHKGALLEDGGKVFTRGTENDGMRAADYTELSAIDGDAVVALVKRAAKLDEAGVKLPRRARDEKAPLAVPVALRKALTTSPKAKAYFAKLTASQRREYLEWIAEAKKPETKLRRVASTIEKLTRGERLNEKYLRK